MLSREVKNTVINLNSFDKALLIEYLFESLNQDEDKENLESWTYESECRLDGVLAGELGLVDFSEITKNLL